MEKKILRYINKTSHYDWVNLNDWLARKYPFSNSEHISSALKNLVQLNKIEVFDNNHFQLSKGIKLNDCKLKARITDSGKNDIQILKANQRANAALFISIIALLTTALTLYLKSIGILK
jgi:hypothetical protein